MNKQRSTQESKNVRICALVVTYNPDVNILGKVLSSLSSEVDKIFIFNNTDGYSSDADIVVFNNNEKIQVFSKYRNIGIAAAQNELLKIAMAGGFDFAIMSDQDTVYPVGYVSGLLKYRNARNNVAAIFPGWLDVNLYGGAKYPGQYVFDSKNRLKIVLSEPEFLEISHAISSGMMINIFHLKSIGLMREELFIDWVDNEWCWRAGSLGYILLAVPSVKIMHTLGDCTVTVFGKNFVKRGAVRNYYIIRNALYLVFHSHIPSAAKIYLAKKTFHHTIFSFLASNNRLAEISSLAKAWVHGLRAKLGKFY